jgi:hypothetical protein
LIKVAYFFTGMWYNFRLALTAASADAGMAQKYGTPTANIARPSGSAITNSTTTSIAPRRT